MYSGTILYRWLPPSSKGTAKSFLREIRNGLKRHSDSSQDFWKKGETPETAVKREVKEELGLDSEIMELVGIYSFFEKNQLIIAYQLSAAGEIKLGDELAEIKWISVDKLKPWPFGTGHAVRDWLAKHSSRR